ncbi:MAG: hypothetical protein R2873_14535 [Caldilineaceae bacterium]
MAFIPTMLLKRLYTFGSLQNTADGVRFGIKNRLSDAKLTSFQRVAINGDVVSPERIVLDFGGGVRMTPSQLNAAGATDFPLRKEVMVEIKGAPLAKGQHIIEIGVQTSPFGKIQFSVDDSISEKADLTRIPRDKEDDYGEDVIKARQAFVEERTGAKLEHAAQYSFDPHLTQGNVENFTGVAQIPLGFAGPLQINGEHAQGEFIIPLATTEGTLVASYNRGMKLLNLSGGVKVTVAGDAMQRAPVFVFEDARGARDFITWVKTNIDTIREEAEATSSVAKLDHIDPYQSNKFAFLRFNFTTGDAAGQNMVGRSPSPPVRGSSITTPASSAST